MSSSHLHFPIINAPITTESFKGNFVGTGVSCGIDSFTTIKEYSQDVISESYRLTHLLYFKVGAHHGLKSPCPPEIEDDIFQKELQIAKDFCHNNDFNLIVVESNINHICDVAFGPVPFEVVAILRNASVMLMLQHLFSKYICASTYATFSDFNADLKKGQEHNLWWSLPLLSSENIEMIVANKSMTRIEKTKYISDYEPSFKNLMVCWKGHINCGECPKCIRTLVSLDLLGALENYSHVFDIEKYKKNRNKHLKRIVVMRYKDPFFREIYDYAVQKNTQLPNTISSLFYAGTLYFGKVSLLRAMKYLINRK